MSFTPGDFRRALGLFPTGVAVVTARAPDGQLLGTTVSSFNSVSLDPPLVLFSLARTVLSFPGWQAATAWGVSETWKLRAGQEHVVRTVGDFPHRDLVDNRRIDSHRRRIGRTIERDAASEQRAAHHGRTTQEATAVQAKGHRRSPQPLRIDLVCGGHMPDCQAKCDNFQPLVGVFKRKLHVSVELVPTYGFG